MIKYWLVAIVAILLAELIVFWVPKTKEKYKSWRTCPLSIRLDDERLKPNKEVVDAILHKDAILVATRQQQIPRIIIQTNETNQIPVDMKHNIQNLIDKNPTYRYLYFDDDASRRFIQENFDDRVLAAYDKLVPGAYKADFFRYCILYKQGGVYVDTGMIALVPFDDYILPTDEFVSPEDTGIGGIYNAFMCSVPEHPIVKKAIEMCIENIENERYHAGKSRGALRITGPFLLAAAFKDIVGAKVVPNTDYGNGIRILKFYSNYDYKCVSGEIFAGDLTVFYTKYPTYRLDQKWYNTKPYYAKMWDDRKVFGEK